MNRSAFLGIIFGLLLCSCTHNKRLEFALDFAGENRAELEKVLEHYNDSGLKLDAARFLIENMPHYYGYEGWQLDSMKTAKAEVIKKRILDEDTRMRWSNFSYQNLKKVYDAQVITAPYLIENIDEAFAVWRGKPWGRSLSFDEFCEWILPYRIDNEPLENWRRAYYDQYAGKLDSLYQGSDAVVAIDSLCTVFNKEKWMYNTDFNLPHFGALFLLNYRVGGCRESCDMSVYALRSLGFPVTTDIYHCSPEYQQGHLWNVLLDTTGRVVPFWFSELKIERDGSGDGRKKGKVYRMCYGEQKEKIGGMYACAEVPSVLRNPFLKDVTTDYFGENVFEIEVDSKLCGDYVYLGVFTPHGWTPVDIAECREGKALVKNIEPDVLFMPLASQGGALIPVGFPFRIEAAGVHYFKPETRTEKAELWRKYPLRDYIVRYMGGVLGSKIELSDRLDFKKIEWAYTIEKQPKINYNTIEPKLKKKCRYIRYVAAKDRKAEIAELAFLDAAGKQIEARVVEGRAHSGRNRNVDCSKINDGSYLSFYHSQALGGSVVLDLGKAEEINKIVYVPRNDENFISMGNLYELFYQNGTQGWVSLGSKRAEQVYLQYDNVPVGALLLLRNLSRGREEHVFYMKGGKQTFMDK